MQRHGRQVALAEVGAAGQARIASARVEVALDGLAAQVAVRYLAGAGVGRLCVPDERLARLALSVDPDLCVDVDASLVPAPEANMGEFGDPVARDLARGARLALAALRSAIGMPR